MPKLSDPEKNMSGPLAIAPVGQLIELRQSIDRQVWLAQYEPQPKIRCVDFNSSDNISRHLHTFRDSSLIGSDIRLNDTARFDENHIAWSYGPSQAKSIACLMGLL